MKPLQHILTRSQNSHFLSLPAQHISSFISHFHSHTLSCSSCASNEQPTSPVSLTPEELGKINLLIPRLCSSNHLKEAINLVDTALLTNASLKSLSLSPLIHHLTSQPDMVHSMSLLHHLKHNPFAQTHINPISLMLISSYFNKHKPKHANKVFDFWSKWGSPNSVVFGAMVNGFCRLGLGLEALKVLRVMLNAGLVPGRDLRSRVYRILLREARIKEAKELNEGLGCVGGGDEGTKKVLALLDHVIENWTE
ncbi:Pentatricopeptide repeat [Dillenia turbinata]|uniref:Pentatricopeptide repeat n=1 Tax=Dillenia turbinata TaxID=194707 RepID=A0AAN8UIR1_9MAGN